MRKITIWLVATLAVVAMATYYQVSLSGDGKEDTRPAAAQSSESASEEPDAAADDGSTTESPEAAREDKADDPYADSDHSGKPGENKPD